MASTSHPDAMSTVSVGGGRKLHLHSDQAQMWSAGVETFKILPSSTQSVSFANFVDLTIQPTDITLLKKVELNLQISALTMSGGSNVRFCNDASFFIQHYEVSVSDQVIESVLPDPNYIRDVLTLTTETKNKVYRVRGNNTKANLVTAASGAQSLFIPIRGFWDSSPHGFFIKSLAGPIRIRCYLDQLANVATCDSGTTPVCTVTAASLYISGRDLATQNQALIAQKIAQQKQLGAVHQTFTSPVHMARQVLQSGNTTYKILLSSFVGNYTHFFVTARLNSSVNTALSNTFDGSAYQSISQLAIIDSAGIILNGVQYPDTYDRFNLIPQYFPGDITDLANGLSGSTPFNLYAIPLCSRPIEAMDHGKFTGCLPMNGTYQLQLTFATSLSVNYVIDIIGYQQKVLQINSNGIAQSLNF